MPDTGAPHNLPFPDGADDPDIPRDIQALAQQSAATTPMVQRGEALVTLDASTITPWLDVTFPVAFPTAPTIVGSAASSQWLAVFDGNLSATGFQVRVRNVLGNAGTPGNQITVRWVATWMP